MNKLTIEDLKVEGKRVVMRVDFNVPLDGDLKVEDASRIEAALPSINYVLERKGRVVLMSHLGRPEHEFDPEMSLKPVAEFLSGVLGKKVPLAPDCIGSRTEEMVSQLKPGEALLLENLRFHRAEEFPEEDKQFARTLASFGDCYVNDAFASCHRKHSSTYTITRYFPSLAAAGFLLSKERAILDQLLTKVNKPFMAIIGGAKIGSKIGVLKSLLNKVDILAVGGGMGYTFLKAQGIPVGRSLVEEKFIHVAKEILTLAAQKRVKFLLPLDALCAKQISEDAEAKIFDFSSPIPDDYQGLDIGPKTIELFCSALKKAQMIFWNGPMGVFELQRFSNGTHSVANAIAEHSILSIAGGGDTLSAINDLEIGDKFTHLSTGGGATLEYLEWGTLPGIEALSDKTPSPLSSSRVD